MKTGKTCGSIGERWRISLASLQGPSPLPMENFASDPAAEQGTPPLEEATHMATKGVENFGAWGGEPPPPPAPVPPGPAVVFLTVVFFGHSVPPRVRLANLCQPLPTFCQSLPRICSFCQPHSVAVAAASSTRSHQCGRRPLAPLPGRCRAFGQTPAQHFAKPWPSICRAMRQALTKRVPNPCQAKPSPSLRQAFAQPLPSLLPRLCQAWKTFARPVPSL